MVRITEDLLRRRAEHNECIIATLEEISLHQQDIERFPMLYSIKTGIHLALSIEYIGKWCRRLKILYLQSNLIPKIENISKLKELEYLNLAINNIEKIENLEGCESLKKLDLTVNFVGELTSITSLKDLEHLSELFLNGNPCCDYEGYKEYVIATLPQVKKLDGVEIEKSERILATQGLQLLTKRIKAQQFDYVLKRKRQKQDAAFKERKRNEKNEEKNGFDGRWYTDIKQTCTITEITSDAEDEEEGHLEDVGDDDDQGIAVIKKETIEQRKERIEKEDEQEKAYWNETSDYTPESRVEMYEHMKDVEKKKEANKTEDFNPNRKRVRKLQTDDGRILNVNEPEIDFTLTDSDDGQSTLLDVSIYRYLDTNHIDIDIQPTYVKILIKGKVLQLTLFSEVKPDSSTAKRSETTGHLLLTMPLLNPAEIIAKVIDYDAKEDNKDQEIIDENKVPFLEVDPTLGVTVDVRNMTLKGQIRENDFDFVDDDSIPPLE